MKIKQYSGHGHLPMSQHITLLIAFIATMAIFCFPSCGDDDKDEPNSSSIVGKWVDGDDNTITFGKDGSYREDSPNSMGQYRIGSYSYSPSTKLLVVNIRAIEGMNNAYQNTYIVQTLNATTLVLLYKDGDTKGFYTRE